MAENKREAKLYQTIGNIEWYELDKRTYEGYNKDLECWQYKLDRDICGLWVLRGQGKDATSHYRQDLMESVNH
jgi:hypothetical protein